jgi:hypothetical protein
MTFWQALLALLLFLLALHFFGVALLPAAAIGIVALLAAVAVLSGR